MPKDYHLNIILELISSYNQTRTSSQYDFLMEILEKTPIDFSYKLEIAKTLLSSNEDEIFEGNSGNGVSKDPYHSLEVLKNLLSTTSNIEVIHKLDACKLLLSYIDFIQDAVKNISEVINLDGIDCLFRYRNLINFVNNYPQVDFTNCFLIFAKNTKNLSRYRILACQNLFLKFPSIPEAICEEIARNEQEEYNVRADAADILIRLGSEEGKKIGREIIKTLGKDINKLNNIYSDRQNVHTDEISVCINNYIHDVLGPMVVKMNSEKVIEEIKQNNLFKILNDPQKDKILASLLRIMLDKDVYPCSQSLSTIFVKVYQLIQEHSESEEILKRLFEELEDMADTCSTGHVNRLIGVLQTYGFTLDIGFKQQLKAYLTHRFQKRINTIPDEQYRDLVLEEMMDLSQPHPNFNKFYRENLMSLRDEMYSEFVETGHITNDKFDEYFRYAVGVFEGLG
jgi:hypothetical protein